MKQINETAERDKALDSVAK